MGWWGGRKGWHEGLVYGSYPSSVRLWKDGSDVLGRGWQGGLLGDIEMQVRLLLPLPPGGAPPHQMKREKVGG